MLLGLVLLGLLLASCVHDEPLPPALPADPILFEDVVPLGQTDDEIAMVDCPSVAADTRYRRPSRRTRRNVAPTSTRLMILPQTPKPTKPVSVEQVIQQANQAALVQPTAEGYFGDRAVYRYVYAPGKIYVVPVNSAQFTKLFFPPGEVPATVPTLNDELWKLVDAKIGPKGRVQAVLGVRPVEDGMRADLSVEMESGRAYFLRFVPSKAPMLAATWELPGAEVADTADTSRADTSTTPACGGTTATMLMPIELAQIHTAYKIEIKGAPSFVPTQIFDDGRKTMVRLKTLAGNAPIVQTYRADGSKGLVQFAPYYIPGDPNRGLYYIIESIWPKFELTSTDGASVVITRLSDTIPVAVRAQ